MRLWRDVHDAHFPHTLTAKYVATHTGRTQPTAAQVPFHGVTFVSEV
jgi:hypothetical protein